MKKLIITWLIACAFLATVAQPQTARKSRSPQERAELITKKLAEALVLNKTQKEAIYQINLRTAREINEALKEARSGPRTEDVRTAMREKLRELNQRRSHAIESELSPTQQTQYKELKEKFSKKVADKRRKQRDDFWKSLENEG